MFGLGMGELVVILAIALIFLGPKRLPDVATTLGKAIRSFRKATRDLTDQLQIDDDVKKPLRELQSALRDEPPPHPPLAVMQGPPPAHEGIQPVPVATGNLPAGTAAPPLADRPIIDAKPLDSKPLDSKKS
ncbi:MAG: putative Sec-independent protein translocase protein TatB [Myxococcales bacterium]|nr:putative Sec-independent protein translocase protein TatB [Myxococcales bacterium]